MLLCCLVLLLTALICLLNRSKCLSGHKLIQFFELYFRTCPVIFFILSFPSMILATTDFFNFSEFYCFAVKICVLDVICSAVGLIALLTSLKMTAELS